MKSKIFIFAIVVLTAHAICAFAQPNAPDTLWTRTYGGSGNDNCNSVQQTSDGGYIVAGATYSYGAGSSDIYLIKTNIAGDTLWTRTYGGSGVDEARSVQQTTDGGYILGGLTASFGAGANDYYLIKTDSLGNTLWTRTYGGSATDNCYGAQQTTDGGYVLAGYTSSYRTGASDVYLIKTNSTGDTLWTRTYGGSATDDARSVQQTSDGGYILAGQTNSFGAGGYDLYLIKTNSTGDTLWTRAYGGSGSDYIGYSVQQTRDGGYIISGYTNSFGAGGYDAYVVKTNSTGDALWTRTYGGISSDYSYYVQQTIDGGYIVLGFTSSFGAGSSDFYLVKTNSNGEIIWTNTYGGSGSDTGKSLQQTRDGGFILAGITASFGAGSNDFYLIRLNWEAHLSTPAPPRNFTITHTQDTLRANLSWINPDSTIGGVPLTDLDGVKIIRNDSLVHTMTNVQIGQPASYQDNSMTAPGWYDYQAIAFNDSGDGFPARCSQWIGRDTPGAPTNVTATPGAGGQLTCALNWTAPVISGHGGYWPAGNWDGQKIYRNGVEVATLPGTNTTYIDTLSYIGWYSYDVAYYNSSGVGPTGAAQPSRVFVGQTLAGSYDIGGGGNHFPTLLAAVSAMNGSGIAGPTVFNVYNGTYDGMVYIHRDSIPGISATNTLTFQAAPGQLPRVTNLFGSGLQGPGFNLTGVRYVTIRGFEISNCNVGGIYMTYLGSDSINNCTVEGNYIHDVGGAGMMAQTPYAIYLARANNCLVIGNEIMGVYYGIYFNYGNNNIFANNILYNQDCYGMRFGYGGNNLVCYNSVYMNSNFAATNYAVYFYNCTNYVVKNNILFNAGAGSATKYAYYISGSLGTYPIISDYNDILAPNSNLGYYLAPLPALTDWQSFTGLDSNSISVDPYFLSVLPPFNLHIADTSACAGMGIPIAQVLIDFDGEPRDPNDPCIGADEVVTARLSVTLTPWRPPIQVNPGGFFWYRGELDNYTPNPINFDLWSEAILPNGVHFGPLLLYTNITIGSMGHIERAMRVNVPRSAPPGNYQYYAAAGTYPSTVIDDDQFPFTITVGEPVSSNDQWLVEPCDENFMPIPTEFSLSNASPNPFNPVTTISFGLPEDARVKLVVYDVSGREAAVLVDGLLPAGLHEVEFNASDLASGIYFYRLSVPGFTMVKKMALVK